MKLNSANRRVALQRVHRLFQLARVMIHEDEELAQRYVAIARRVAMASRVRIPREYGRHLCRGCKKLILPGVNCHVRVQPRRETHLVVTCGHCGAHLRIPLRAHERVGNADT